MANLPKSALLTEEHMALFVDYYELTMGQADFDSGKNSICTENYFARAIPQGEYLIAAGLEQVIQYILNLRFSEGDLQWLQSSKSIPEMSPRFVDYLRNFKFDGDVYAVPEGTIVLPNEPIINITGNSIDIQIFETYLLSVMNFQTLIATKASRIVNVSGGRTCFDFGARRAHGRDAAVLSARASFIGGISATSLVIASRYFGIPYVGTLAHKFIQDRSSELEAFRDYAMSFPHNTILLIDTYDTVQGAKHAVTVGQEMKANGQKLIGVRLDSGNLLELSKQVRFILDDGDLEEAKIFASNDLDEFEIDRLLKSGAPIDGFGIGTRLATGATLDPISGNSGVSALPGVYKHVEKIEGDKTIFTLKMSNDMAKSTLPAKKQIQRFTDPDQYYIKDKICLWNEVDQGGLLIPIVEKGKLVYDFPTLQEIQIQTQSNLSHLPNKHKTLYQPATYPVILSEKLKNLQRELINEKQSNAS